MELSPRAARNRREYKKLNIYTIAACAAAAACVVALIFTLWFSAVIIEDNGMTPTLERGDTLLCDKLALLFLTPKRGDIVCYKPAYGSGVYTARVVALPGEEFAVYSGKIYINGCLLEEDYIAQACAEDIEPITVPAGSFLLLPDARQSIASAAPEELIISEKRIIGRVAVRVAPLARAAIFK